MNWFYQPSQTPPMEYGISVSTAKFVVSNTESSTTGFESFDALKLDAKDGVFQTPADNDWYYPNLTGWFSVPQWATITIDSSIKSQGTGSLDYTWTQSNFVGFILRLSGYNWSDIDISTYDYIAMDFYIEDVNKFDVLAVTVNFSDGGEDDGFLLQEELVIGWNTVYLNIDNVRNNSKYPDIYSPNISNIEITVQGVDDTTTHANKKIKFDNLRFIEETKHEIRFKISKAYSISISSQTYSVSNNNVSFDYKKAVKIDSASYSVSNNNVSFKRTYIVNVSTQTYSVTNNNVKLGRQFTLPITLQSYSISNNNINLNFGYILAIDTQTYETNLGVFVETLAEGFENNPPNQIGWAGFDAAGDAARTRSTNFVSQGTYSLRWSGSYGFAYGIFNASEIPSYATKIKLDAYIETSTDAVVALGGNSVEILYAQINQTGTSVGWYQLELTLTEEFKESTDGIVQIATLSEDWETSETGPAITQPFSVYIDNLRWVETTGTASVDFNISRNYNLQIDTKNIHIGSFLENETLIESFDNNVVEDNNWTYFQVSNYLTEPTITAPSNLGIFFPSEGSAFLSCDFEIWPSKAYIYSDALSPYDLSGYDAVYVDLAISFFQSTDDSNLPFIAVSNTPNRDGILDRTFKLSEDDEEWETVKLDLRNITSDTTETYFVFGCENDVDGNTIHFFLDNLRGVNYLENENTVNFNIGRGIQIYTTSFTVTNNDVDLNYGSITYITVDNQSYTVTTNNLNFNRNYVLGIQAQSYAVTNNNINLNFGFNHIVDNQSYAVTNNNLNFNRNYVLGIQAQSFAVTTNDVNLFYGYNLKIDTQSYTVTNNNLNLFYGYGITLETQVYDIDTNNITYKIGYRVINDTQSYDVITNDIQFNNGYNLKIDTQSYAAVTNDITYRKNYRNIINTQTYTVTNNDVFYNRDYVLGIQTQSYIAFTNALTFNGQRQLTINNSNITANNNQVGLIRSHIFNIDVQEYTVTPQDINMRYGFTLSIQTQEYQTQTYDINYLRTYVSMISKKDFFVNDFPLNLRKTNILDIDTQSYEIDNNDNILQLSKKLLINTTTYNSDFEDIGLLATRLANIQNRNFSVNTIDNQLRKTSIINLETRQIDVENKDNNLLRDTLCSLQTQSFNIDTFNNNLLKSNRLPIEQQAYTVDTLNVDYKKTWMIPINSVNYSIIYNPVDLRFRPFMRVMIDTTPYDITYQDVNLKIGRLINVSTNEFNVEFEPFQYLVKFYKVTPLTAYYSGNKGIEVVYTPEYSIKPVAASNKELTITITMGMP